MSVTVTTKPAEPQESSRHGLGDSLRGWWEGLSRPAQWGVGVPVLALLALLPLFPPPGIDTPSYNFGLVMAQVAMYCLVAIGLNVVVGQAGLLDLGYVGFYAVGAYTVALLTSKNSPWNQTAGGWLDPKWAWLACLPLAVVVTALSGLILGSPTLRLRGDYLAIVTLGFGEIVRLLADNLNEITNGSLGLSEVAYPHLGESADKPKGWFSAGNGGDSSSLNPLDRAGYGTYWYWFGMILIIVMLLIVGNLERSRVGRAWVAIREDEDAAEIMGVPTFKYKLWAFTIGAAVGGISGAMYAGQVQFVNPTQFNVVNSMLFLCAVVIGGQGNKLGVLAGAFIIAYLPARLASVKITSDETTGYVYLLVDVAIFVGLYLLYRFRGARMSHWPRRGVITGMVITGVMAALLLGSVLLFRKGGAQSLGDLKYLYFGVALVVMMILRPQGLFPVRQKLLTFGRQVFQAVRRPAEPGPIGAGR
ncbi:branched-chain amino acid ABC transporter permease [Nocardia pseudobrasiliensis]|uniref:Amino acid/amide ABC transporter membrane protein 2 (HAAT family) n=1 Tax=Nocardia pseudobrasiliensis TaxID=45979 RepID=A0A370I3Z7_9NOCA|nr:branched-chain amino acid ABC transporter permease [Nocardia pseudobrasiliensis]RDI65456.1 amino acid/amide ABC transporter membrane protein 2 (HAAT family) [Nocardia pseudobrasiliensis]